MPVALIAPPAQNPFSNPHPYRSSLLGAPLSPLKSSPFSQFPVLQRFRQSMRRTASSQRRIGVFVSGEGSDLNERRDGRSYPSLDAMLSVAEIVCIAPPVICSIGCVAGQLFPGVSKQLQELLGSRIFILQFVLLVGAVAIGALIRERRWRRICRDDRLGVDLVARIEKVEVDLRSSATIVRVLSRQLEKLGIRFRVTRKTLKEPISETAALAQKNSEATRALAVQEDILEKELGEIQKVLLAMQEQQQKQLELILAIGKAGRLLENKKDAGRQAQAPIELSESVPGKKEREHLEAQTGLGASNDKA